MILPRAEVVELADTLGLEPSALRREGSSPSLGIIFEKVLKNFDKSLLMFLALFCSEVAQ